MKTFKHYLNEEAKRIAFEDMRKSKCNIALFYIAKKLREFPKEILIPIRL